MQQTFSRIRPVDPRRDLLSVADLIELSFSDQMDKDGREYLRQIRRAARESNFLRWAPGPSERISIPLHGYVWEENNRVVGNLTLTPNRYNGQWMYLIANVAVHPDYQRRGIGRELTMKALEHIRKHSVKTAWLQVRDDNQAAQNLYHSLGFGEQTRRTNWVSADLANPSPETPGGVRVLRRTSSDWETQRTWLEATYSKNVAWYLMFNAKRFSPSFWQSVLHFIDGKEMHHWAAYSSSELIGTATWEPGRTFADVLWLALDPDQEEAAIQALLPHAQREMAAKRRPLIINYPGGRCKQAFQAANFQAQNTLIWMKINLSENSR